MPTKGICICQANWVHYSERICSLHFGFILFSRSLPTCFREKGPFRKDSNCALNKLKSGQGEEFCARPTEVYKTRVRVHSKGRTGPGRSAHEPNRRGTCPTTRPRSPSAGSPRSQVILWLLRLAVTRASDFYVQYLESRGVRRETFHVELGPHAEPAEEIVSVHFYPESTAVPRRLRRGLPPPEGLGPDRGRKWFWGAESGGCEKPDGFTLLSFVLSRNIYEDPLMLGTILYCGEQHLKIPRLKKLNILVETKILLSKIISERGKCFETNNGVIDRERMGIHFEVD